MQGTNRTKLTAARKIILKDEWTSHRCDFSNKIREELACAVELNYRKPGSNVLMFLDASDLFWASYGTQVSANQFIAGLQVADMTHEPLSFLSGVFKGYELRSATVDEEGCAIVSTFRRMGVMLGCGGYISDDRNLAHIFGVTTNSPPSKTTPQSLVRWRAFLRMYSFQSNIFLERKTCGAIHCHGGHPLE